MYTSIQIYRYTDISICLYIQYIVYIYIYATTLRNPLRRRFRCILMCQGTFVWKKCFYTMCSVRLIFSIAVEKCNGRRNLLHSWKNMVVKGTCCIQVTICLDDISSSKKQYSCRTIQYVEKCNTTFNEAQPS